MDRSDVETVIFKIANGFLANNGQSYNNNNAQHPSSGNHVHTNGFMHGERKQKHLSFRSTISLTALSRVHIITFPVFEKEHHSVCNRGEKINFELRSKFLCH